MARPKHCCLAVVLLLSMGASYFVARSCADAGILREGLQPPEGVVLFESEGGTIRVWNGSFQPLREAHLGAAELTLQPRGLALPKYASAAEFLLVLHGRGRAGIVYPSGTPTNVYRVEAGDVIAVPRGWVTWLYNDDDQTPLHCFAVAETSAGPAPGFYQGFNLAGAKGRRFGGILHGFSTSVLSRVWNVSKDTVEAVLQAQKGRKIIKVKEAPGMGWDSDTTAGREAGGDSNGGGEGLARFQYRWADAVPEVAVEGAGSFSVLTHDKLWVLRHLGLGGVRVSLEKGAILAPNWYTNAHSVGFVTSGQGRLQIAFPDGTPALDATVGTGSVFVVPAFYPYTVVSSEQGLDWVQITSNSNPVPTFLAGSNSALHYIPYDVFQWSFNVTADVKKQILDARAQDAVILPKPRSPTDDALDEKLREIMVPLRGKKGPHFLETTVLLDDAKD